VSEPLNDESEQTARLDEWWNSLTDSEQGAIYRRDVLAPMAPWLVDSLLRAHVAGLVEQPRNSSDAVIPPWFLMPRAVVEYVDQRRSEPGPADTQT
jgi:hypothetical protein